VYVPRSWTGHLTFDTAEQWAAWEADYERYILRMARLADSTEVDLFCIGTEFRKSVEQRPQFWQNLIKKCGRPIPANSPTLPTGTTGSTFPSGINSISSA
jgi:hypothetical protein